MLEACRSGLRLLFAVLAASVSATPALATTATGKLGAVAAEHRLASRAGVEILRSGGTAVDAAIAAALATGVVNPSSSGLGGGGFLVVYTAAEGRTHVIDFRERAPEAATRDFFIRKGKPDTQASKVGGKAVGVPGEAAGFALALERFGTKSFAQVAAPAIRLAQEGFTVEQHLASQIARKAPAFADRPELAKTFLHADGTPIAVGETLYRKDLAATLRLLAQQGGEAFYQGGLAADIVAAANAEGGALTGDDLHSYRALERPPLIVPFRRWQLVSVPPPSSGGGTMGEALSILSPYPLRQLGRNSPTYLHLLAESFKAAFADRARYYGDPDSVTVPLKRLLSPEHAAAIRRRLSAVRTLPSSSYGSVATASDSGTTHISVVDRFGNGAALTTSINTSFGSLVVVPGRGIILNNTMDDFSIQPGVPNAFGLIGNEANSVAPLKRPLSSMSPTLVIAADGLRLAVGASGGPMIISSTLQTALNVLIFDLDVGAAVQAPRIHHQWMPEMLGVEKALPVSVRRSLQRRGHTIREFNSIGAVQAVEVIHKGDQRMVRAVSDNRKGGIPAAE